MAVKTSSSRCLIEAILRAQRTTGARLRASAGLGRMALIGALVLLTPLVIILMRPSVHAGLNVITVNSLADDSTSDDGVCSLRKAINNANSPNVDTTGGDCTTGTGLDDIEFDSSLDLGEISLGSRLPPIQNNLTINLNNVEITISGGGSVECFLVLSNAALTINDLFIGGCVNNGGVGGAIANDGTLIVNDSLLGLDSAVFGGAISNGTQGTLEIFSSGFIENYASIDGGVILNSGSMFILESEFEDNIAEVNGGVIDTSGPTTISNSNLGLANEGNLADNNGGAIDVVTGTTSVDSSTFQYDGAGGVGGAINVESGANLTLTNSAVYLNDATEGGGIYSSGKLTVVNSTFTSNTGVGTCIYFADGKATISFSTFYATPSQTSCLAIIKADTLTISASILTHLVEGVNCAAAVAPPIDGGYNISDDDSCSFTATGSSNNTDPELDTTDGLTNNGGPTDTVALEPGSPAINQVPDNLCPLTDQRSYARPGDSQSDCDIGAFEFDSVSVPTPTATPSPTHTPRPSRTATPTGTATPIPTPTITVTATVSVTATGTGTPTATATATGVPTITATSTTVAPTPTATPTVVPPTSTAVVTATATPTPAPTTAAPTPTPTPLVTLLPSSLSFGNVKVGSTSAPQTVTLNNQDGLLKVSGWSISSGFAVTSGGTCPTPPFQLLPGQSCTYMIVFKPKYTGKTTGLFQVFDNAKGGSQKVTLTGTGTTK